MTDHQKYTSQNRLAWDEIAEVRQKKWRPEICQGWSHFSGADEAVETKYEFSWSLGDIVTSLAKAGLRIELLDERPSEAGWRFGDKLDEVARIPCAFLLVAVK